MSRLGDMILNERLRYNLTVKQVAQRCGVAVKFLQDVESGKRIIADEQARRILRKIGSVSAPESQFTLDDIAEEFDSARAVDEQQQENTRAARPAPIVNTVADESTQSDAWMDALSSIMKRVPVYDSDWTITDHRLLPVIQGKIHGGAPDKVLYARAPDDSMRGFRITSGDHVLVVPTQHFQDGDIILLNAEGKRMMRKIRKLSGNRLALQWFDQMFSEKIMPSSEVTIMGKCVKLEIDLDIKGE